MEEDKNLSQSPVQSSSIEQASSAIPQVSETPKQKFKLLSLFIAIISILFISLIAGLYVYKYQGSKITVKSNPVPIITQATSPDNTPSSPDKLLDVWSMGTKTYSSPDLGFTLEYPKIFVATPYDFGFIIKTPDEYRNEDAMHITLTAIKNTDSISLQEYLKGKYGQPYHPGGNPSQTEEGKMKDFKPSNIPLENSYSYSGDIGGGGPSKTLFFEYKGVFYELVLYGGEGAGAGYSPEAGKIYDQVVSTIKFK